MTDPFQFEKAALLTDDPMFCAPDEAVSAWRELAEAARAELTRMGFAATVLDRFSAGRPPAGAQILVNDIQPFGVTLDWHAPVEDEESYRTHLLRQDSEDPFVGYVITAGELIARSLLEVVRAAGFRTLVDHEERQTYHYRVLEAPRFPLH
ncbi:hypothetical protein VA596_32045 [Amycolatopsis sp., V23-08]|uniref:Uncharacterized protein n=1 Tax=Amycolatopsis heterodermiae TaxID=3110235 RepID=A0ABU5RD66_9PSEU|nr:hypothetical protein [Amycolatopsis sp., V23-08]MEA5364201.1 hypothetical protein [Amycolatopsis sp., V23-08]